MSQAGNMEIYRDYQWITEIFPIKEAFDQEDYTVLVLEQPAFACIMDVMTHHVKFAEYDKWHLRNGVEFTDKPGEWSCDRETGTIYYIPKDGETPETTEFYVSSTEKIVEIAGENSSNRAENIVFSGLTFNYASYTATNTDGFVNTQATVHLGYSYEKSTNNNELRGGISVYNARNIRFEDNVFEHMDSCGLSVIHTSSNVDIVGNVFTDISGSAITVGTSGQNRVADSDTICIQTSIDHELDT